MIIYKIFNKINGKIYIGQTIQKLSRRLAKHIRENTYPVQRALNKYGINSFDISITDTAESNKILSEKERYWIKFYNSQSPNGYNLTIGGEGVVSPSQEVREKLRLFNTGRKQSKESIEKTRIANIGRKHSDEWNKKISESNKGHAGTRIPAVITEKKCNTCLETKPLNEFHKSRGQGGVRSTCKHCRSEAKKALPKKTRVPYLRTSEMREKISQSLMGHSVSEETRKKMSLKKIGVKRPDYKRRKQV